MKFIDFFAGIGGFRRGMELAGHECIGFCEFDKFATASYISMHLLTDEQRKTLEDIPIKKRQKEILKEEYRNGEWYANDIRRVNAGAKQPIIPMTVSEIHFLCYKNERAVRFDAIGKEDMGESCYRLEDIGRIVFLTREEAEKKLEEMQNG
nr:MAG: C-5 cytosine-specific DNA methylase [Bacteriophage sp.]